jgi:hypothetical protein
MKWYGSRGKQKAPLTSKEGVEISVQDDDGEECRGRQREGLEAKWSKQQEETAQTDKCHARALSSFKIEVVGRRLAFENEARPGDSAAADVGSDDAQ